MRNAYCLSFLTLVLGLSWAAEPSPVKVTEEKDLDSTSYMATGPLYTATVGPSGMLTSIKVGNIEMLKDGLVFPDGNKPELQKATILTEPLPGLNMKVLSKAGPVDVTYTFEKDHIRARMSHTLGQWQRFKLGFNPDTTLAFEDLQNRGTSGGGEAISYVEHGPKFAAPIDRLSRMQMFRAYYPDFNVKCWHDGWGAPFNIDEMGGISGCTYGKGLMEGNKPMTFHFVIEPVAEKGRKPGPVFIPQSDRFSNLFYVGEKVTWKLVPKKETVARVPADAKEVIASWTLHDFWGNEAGKGQQAFKPADLAAPLGVTVTPKGRGWFYAVFALSVPGTPLLPSEFVTRLAMIEKVPGLAERPAPDAKLPGEFGNAALMGMKCVRMSHEMKGYFPDPKTEKWKELDEVFSTCAAETKTWNIAAFFQANARPGWADPAQYEELVFKMVNRYKDRCKVWEVENEPNFGYSPADYITKCLIPFAKGAKRADPDCVVMGPACVCVPDTIRFMDEVYKQGANKYLDAVSTHTYMGPGESWEQFGNLRYLTHLREMMKAHGEGAKQLWQTEQGYTWGHEPKQRQSRYVTRQYLCGYLSGIPNERQYYFYPVHNGFEPWYLIESGSSTGKNGTWEPGAAAVRAMAETLAGTTFVKQEASPVEGIYVARFTADDREVFAMWTLDFPVACTLAVTGAKELRDIMGNAKPATDQVQVTLSGEPQYLIAGKGAEFRFVKPYFGRNLAGISAGAVYTASSSRGDVKPSFAGDGRWSQRDGASGMSGQRTYWCPAKPVTPDGPPHWLQLKLPMARKVDRILILSCLEAVEPNPRDYQIQAWVGDAWKTVAEGKDTETWTIYHEFPVVETDQLRLVVSKINDGWHLGGRWMYMVNDEFKRYTDCLEKICDVQVYGPPNVAEVTSTVDPAKVAVPGTVKMNVTIAGYADATFSGQIVPQLPEGWTSQPASAPLSLAKKGDVKQVEFSLQMARTVKAGVVPVSVAIQDAAGKPVDLAGVMLEVPDPLKLDPLSPDQLDAAAQRLGVRLQNLTPGQLKGKLTLSAKLGDKSFHEEQTFDMQKETAQVSTFTLKDFDLAASGATVTYRAECDSGVYLEATKTLRVTPYSFIGAFSNADKEGFAAVYPPEKEVDLKKTYPGAGGEAKWQKGASDPGGLLDFTKLIPKRDWVVAYAVTFVESPLEQKVTLSCGSDDGLKVWVNGQEVIADDAYRGASPGQDEAPITLKKGWNTILAKVTQGDGGWGLYLSLLDAKGEPLNNVKYAYTPKP